MRRFNRGSRATAWDTVLAFGVNHLPRMSYRELVKLALPAVVLLVAIALVVKPSKATIGVSSRADLAGNWQIALGGNTGCGLGTLLVTVSLPASGNGTASLTSHGQCGNSTVTGQSFTVDSLNSTGTGKVGISCGAGCGWTFNIQVAPDRSTFNLVDTTDPNNFLVGTAVHQ